MKYHTEAKEAHLGAKEAQQWSLETGHRIRGGGGCPLGPNKAHFGAIERYALEQRIFTITTEGWILAIEEWMDVAGAAT